MREEHKRFRIGRRGSMTIEGRAITIEGTATESGGAVVVKAQSVLARVASWLRPKRVPNIAGTPAQDALARATAVAQAAVNAAQQAQSAGQSLNSAATQAAIQQAAQQAHQQYTTPVLAAQQAAPSASTVLQQMTRVAAPSPSAAAAKTAAPAHPASAVQWSQSSNPDVVLRSGLTSALRGRQVPETAIKRIVELPAPALGAMLSAAGGVIAETAAKRNLRGAESALEAAFAAKGMQISKISGAGALELPAGVPTDPAALKGLVGDVGKIASDAVREVPVVGGVVSSLVESGTGIIGGILDGIGDTVLSIFGASPAQKAARNAIAQLNVEMAILEAHKAFAKQPGPGGDAARAELAKRGFAVREDGTLAAIPPGMPPPAAPLPPGVKGDAAVVAAEATRKDGGQSAKHSPAVAVRTYGLPAGVGVVGALALAAAGAPILAPLPLAAGGVWAWRRSRS